MVCKQWRELGKRGPYAREIQRSFINKIMKALKTSVRVGRKFVFYAWRKFGWKGGDNVWMTFWNRVDMGFSLGSFYIICLSALNILYNFVYLGPDWKSFYGKVFSWVVQEISVPDSMFNIFRYGLVCHQWCFIPESQTLWPNECYKILQLGSLGLFSFPRLHITFFVQFFPLEDLFIMLI